MDGYFLGVIGSNFHVLEFEVNVFEDIVNGDFGRGMNIKFLFGGISG